MSEQITKNFTLEELTRGNAPTPKQRKRLIALIKNVLQPIRDHYNVPVDISSGLRSFDSNKACGGADLSQHLHGEASDFHVRGVPNREVYEWAKKNINYDQLILEHDKEGNEWLHASYVENRKEAFELEKK